ncbi:MAG: cytochrome C oxidase Cbb3 [Campylobacter sp.]|nr:cytochrome C oxidase Cbb3 [Campylobacter sp.]
MKWFNLSDTVNLLTIIAAIVLVAATIFVVGIYMKQMKTKKSGGKFREGISHDDIKEYDNPIPMGWAVVYVILIVWAVWYYLVGYPLNSYSQIGAYNEEVKAYNEKFEKTFSNPDQATLLAMGEGIFLTQCSACHGISGSGINGKAADLTVWGSEQGIIDAIDKGSKGLDYPLGEMPAKNLEGREALAAAAFMAQEISSIGKTSRPELVEEGRENWAICAACHGEDGKGMDGLAPDMTEYGSFESVVNVLNRGKLGHIGDMPKFIDGRLSDVQKQAVGEYILSLSKE